MNVIAVIEPVCADAADRRPAVVRPIRSAELFDMLRAVSPGERLATKPRPFGPPPATPAGTARSPEDPAADPPREWSYEPVLDELSIPNPVTAGPQGAGAGLSRPRPTLAQRPRYSACIPRAFRLTPPADW